MGTCSQSFIFSTKLLPYIRFMVVCGQVMNSEKEDQVNTWPEIADPTPSVR